MGRGRDRRQRRRRAAVVGGAAVAAKKHHDAREAQQREEASARQQAGPSGPGQEAQPAAGDYTVELEKLAKLRDDGVITAEDYEAKKKQLLGI
jgi:Short C-terminal domain